MASKYNENLKDVFSSCVMKFDKNDPFYTKVTNVKKKKKKKTNKTGLHPQGMV